MTRGNATGPEKAIDGLAATAWAACVAWSLSRWGLAPLGAGGLGAVGGLVAFVALGRIGGAESPLQFLPLELAFDDPADDTLLLEDRLDEPAADSPVVRLFAVGGGGRHMQAHVPGELAERIDHFLGERPPLRAVPPPPDAAHELYEALAAIRRTLR